MIEDLKKTGGDLLSRVSSTIVRRGGLTSVLGSFSGNQPFISGLLII